MSIFASFDHLLHEFMQQVPTKNYELIFCCKTIMLNCRERFGNEAKRFFDQNGQNYMTTYLKLQFQ